MTASNESGGGAAEERERQLSYLVDMVPSHIWRLTPEGEPTFFNRRMVAFLGLDVADIGHSGASKLPALVAMTVHRDEAERFENALREALRTGHTFSMKYRLRRADGVYRWMSSRAEPMRDQQGRIVQWYGLCHDIDDQVKAEEALRQSERRLQQLIDTVPALIWSTSSNGKPTYINKRLEDTVGVTLDDLLAIGGSRSLADIHPDDRLAVDRALNHSFNTGDVFEMTYRQRRANGGYRWTEGRAEPLREESGDIAHWFGVCVDVHDRVLSQEALQDRERQLQQLIDTVPVQIWAVTPTGQPAYINKTMIDFIGLKLGDFDEQGGLPSAIQTIVHPDDRVALLGALKHSFTTGEPFELKFRNLRWDGVYRWTQGRAAPLRDDSNGIIRWFGVNVDIHDVVTSQDALRERERELSQLVDTVPGLIWCLTRDGQPSYYNRQLVEWLGIDVTDLDTPEMTRIGMAARTLVHPDESASVHEELERCVRTGEPFCQKYRVRRGDGVFRWIEGRAQPIVDADGKVVQWYGVLLDIDDLMRAQEALRDRERELSQLVDMVPSYLWRLTPDGEPNFFNKRLVEFFGLDVSAMEKPGVNRLAAVVEAAVHPEDAVAMQAALRRSFATGESFSMKHRLRRADGVYRWVDGGAEPMRSDDGRIVQWYGLSHDIDDQLRVEDALRERERFLWQLVETLPAMIDCAAPNGEPVYRSQQLREFLGYSLEELDSTGRSRLAATLDAGVHPDDLAGVKAGYAHSLSTGEPYARRHRLRRFDGEYRWVETRGAPMRDSEGVIVQWNVICLDIDEEVRTQEKLRLAQESLARANQAASLAELSASIAHEVNQPLAAVVANSHACQRWLMTLPPNIDRAKTIVERILRDANAAADIVSRIRALFKRSTQLRAVSKLQAAIAEAQSLMANDLAEKRVSMSTEVDANLPPMFFDRVQIQQVLINLLRNGMEAMDHVDGAKTLKIRAKQSGGLVRVEISDVGGGVEFPDKIFEPFFTTKQHGMGMGLAICRSIVESHGGRLWAAPTGTTGTTFVFTLPIEAKDAASTSS